MRNGQRLLVATIALTLSVLPTAREARADPPAAAPAAGSTPAPATAAPAGSAKKKPAPPAHTPAHAKPAKTPAGKKDTTSDHPPDAPTEGGAKPRPAGAASSAHEVVEHESRIEFDERMVRGQSAAGAIFLFQRSPSELKSIVEVPDTFRPKTVEMLQPRGTP